MEVWDLFQVSGVGGRYWQNSYRATFLKICYHSVESGCFCWPLNQTKPSGSGALLFAMCRMASWSLAFVIGQSMIMNCSLFISGRSILLRKSSMAERDGSVWDESRFFVGFLKTIINFFQYMGYFTSWMFKVNVTSAAGTQSFLVPWNLLCLSLNFWGHSWVHAPLEWGGACTQDVRWERHYFTTNNFFCLLSEDSYY